MEELKRLREEKNWSQTRLARESGVDRATINQVEGGRRSPTISTLEVLATAMGVEVADFFPKAQASLWSGEPPEGRPELSWEAAQAHAKMGAQLAKVWEPELEDRVEAQDLEWLMRVGRILTYYGDVLKELFENVTFPDAKKAHDAAFLAVDLNAFFARVEEALPRVKEATEKTKAEAEKRVV